MFEYKVLPLSSDHEKATANLNQLGEQGWDLVAVTEYCEPEMGEYEAINHITAYLKRCRSATSKTWEEEQE